MNNVMNMTMWKCENEGMPVVKHELSIEAIRHFFWRRHLEFY